MRQEVRVRWQVWVGSELVRRGGEYDDDNGDNCDRRVAGR